MAARPSFNNSAIGVRDEPVINDVFNLAWLHKWRGRRRFPLSRQRPCELSPAFMVFEKMMQPPFPRSRSDHVSLARLFKARGAIT